eukprot:scaffold52279_cov53-Phaeocystis_antarctica.AAC.3
MVLCIWYCMHLRRWARRRRCRGAAYPRASRPPSAGRRGTAPAWHIARDGAWRRGANAHAHAHGHAHAHAHAHAHTRAMHVHVCMCAPAGRGRSRAAAAAVRGGTYSVAGPRARAQATPPKGM